MRGATVTFTGDAAHALREAQPFFTRRPVLTNLVATLLAARATHPEPGRFWIARERGEVCGVVFQSPLDYPAIVVPMSARIVGAAVRAIAGDVRLPGVRGDAATASAFAGAWAERRSARVVPVRMLRLYEARRLRSSPQAPGRFRQAVEADRDVIVRWTPELQLELGEPMADPREVVDRRLALGQFWLWEHGGAVSMAAASEPANGVVRVQMVFTPPEHRNLGYASACVGALSRRILDAGDRCILYTDLANPTPQSVYRRLGYRAVEDFLSYRFS